MWTIHELFVLFMYWNLPKLKLQEELENAQERTKWSCTSQVHQETASISAPLLDPGPGSLASVSNTGQYQPIPEEKHSSEYHSVSPSHSSVPKTPPRIIERQVANEVFCTSSNEFIEGAENLMSMTPGTQCRVAASRNEPHFQQLLTEASPEMGYGSLNDNSMVFTEDHFCEEIQPEMRANGGPAANQECSSETRQTSWSWRYYYDGTDNRYLQHIC